MITLFVFSGIRRGELCGLKWSDIDMENKTIDIQRELIYIPQNGLLESTTKTTGSKRVIKIADQAINLLMEYKKAQTIDRVKAGNQWNPNNYIFTREKGDPLHPDSITKWFHNFVVKNNLPDISIHSLRHTNAPLLIANGVNTITVAKRMRHKNPSTTTNIYAHAIKSADENASDVLQNIFIKKSTK